MITFETQKNILVAAIDSFHSDIFPECINCLFLSSCSIAMCSAEKRNDNREVFFIHAYDKRILDYKL